MFFFKNHGENKVGRLVQDLVLFIGKTFTWGKSKWLAPYFQYILLVLDLFIQ